MIIIIIIIIIITIIIILKKFLIPNIHAWQIMLWHEVQNNVYTIKSVLHFLEILAQNITV